MTSPGGSNESYKAQRLPWANETALHKGGAVLPHDATPACCSVPLCPWPWGCVTHHPTPRGLSPQPVHALPVLEGQELQTGALLGPG